LDNGIRFAGIANKDGKMVCHAYRTGVVPMLTARETEISVLQSVIRASTRRNLEKKMGKSLFSYTRYEKVKRVTIPLSDKSNDLQIFMASFEIDFVPEPIVMGKIIPLLQELEI
jgi:hypothetical protein